MLRNCWKIAFLCDLLYRCLTAPGIVHRLENFSNVFPQFGPNSAPSQFVSENTLVHLPRHFSDTFSGKVNKKCFNNNFSFLLCWHWKSQFHLRYNNCRVSFTETFWCSTVMWKVAVCICKCKSHGIWAHFCQSTGFISLSIASRAQLNSDVQYKWVSFSGSVTNSP